MLRVTSKIPLDTIRPCRVGYYCPFPSMCVTFPTTCLKPIFNSASVNSNTTRAPITQQDETYSSALSTSHCLLPHKSRQQPSKEENIQISCHAVVFLHLDPLLSRLNRSSGELTANRSRRIAAQGKRQTSVSPRSGFWQNSTGCLWARQTSSITEPPHALNKTAFALGKRKMFF